MHFSHLLISIVILSISGTRAKIAKENASSSSGVLLLDGSIFNFYFYLNNNADLTTAGIETMTEAEAHWLQHGISEGRQGSGQFHTRQYLDRHPQLATQLNHNYTAAAIHYVQQGRAAGLLGYAENGAPYGRYTIGDPVADIYVSGSNRTAGAIDSLVWNNVEFLNAWDHGRELQLAVTTQHGECFNPTEAGNRVDLRAENTTSVLQHAFTSASSGASLAPEADVPARKLSTSAMPAFWMLPNTPHADPTANCSVAINKVPVSGFRINKTVSLAPYGLRSAVLLDAGVLVPDYQARVQLECFTGYHVANFSVFRRFNSTAGALSPPTSCPLNHGCPPPSEPGNFSPLVLATSDGSAAIGAISAYPPSPELSGYVQFYFDEDQAAATTSKWTILRVWYNVQPGTVLQVKTGLCVGNLSSVTVCMTNLHRQFATTTLP